MTTTTKTYDAQSVATRLHYLEDKLKGFVPSEGQDLTAVISGLNRLYRFTLSGPNGAEITYDMPDGVFYSWGGSNPFRSIVSVTYGNEDNLARVATVPLIVQVLGFSSDWHSMFVPVGMEDPDTKSLTGTLFETPEKLAAIRARNGSLLGELGIDKFGTNLVTSDHGSILEAMYGWAYEYDPDARTKSLLQIIRDLESQLNELKSRVEWIENNP